MFSPVFVIYNIKDRKLTSHKRYLDISPLIFNVQRFAIYNPLYSNYTKYFQKSVHYIPITWSISKKIIHCTPITWSISKKFSTIFRLHEVFPKKYPLYSDYMKYFQKIIHYIPITSSILKKYPLHSDYIKYFIKVPTIFRLHEILPKKLSTIFRLHKVYPKNVSTIFRLHQVFPKQFPLYSDYIKYFQKNNEILHLFGI